MHISIDIDTLGVCAYELANESVSKSEVGVVSLLALRWLFFFFLVLLCFTCLN